MRAIPRGRPQSFKPSQVGSISREARILSRAIRENPGAAGEDSHSAARRAGPALHEEESGWELGDLTRENARGPIPTAERELELMCTW